MESGRMRQHRRSHRRPLTPWWTTVRSSAGRRSTSRQVPRLPERGDGAGHRAGRVWNGPGRSEINDETDAQPAIRTAQATLAVDATVNSRVPRTFPAAAVLLPLTSACLLRSWLGVRPFPSIDELAYAPSFRAAADAAPYARDLMVSGMPNHAFIWSLTFRFAEASGHLATVMYALTFVLSALT